MLDIGLCGTEGVYFATFHWQLDGGVMVTASHNPPDYNGLKLVREQSKPIGSDSGLKDIAAMIASGKLPPPAAAKGKVEKLDTSARLHRAPAGLRESQGAAQAQGGGRRRQWRRRA